MVNFLLWTQWKWNNKGPPNRMKIEFQLEKCASRLVLKMVNRMDKTDSVCKCKQCFYIVFNEHWNFHNAYTRKCTPIPTQRHTDTCTRLSMFTNLYSRVYVVQSTNSLINTRIYMTRDGVRVRERAKKEHSHIPPTYIHTQFLDNVPWDYRKKCIIYTYMYIFEVIRKTGPIGSEPMTVPEPAQPQHTKTVQVFAVDSQHQQKQNWFSFV